MTISDIVFYKNLGLQLKEIRGIKDLTPEQHGALFTEKLSESMFSILTLPPR